MHPSENTDLELVAEVRRRAAVYCQMNFPARWQAGAPAWVAGRGCWLIPVVLRLASGSEVELGQLAFDGQTMRLATPRQIMVDRLRTAPPEA